MKKTTKAATQATAAGVNHLAEMREQGVRVLIAPQ